MKYSGEYLCIIKPWNKLYWLHIPSGTQGQREFTATDESEMLSRGYRNEYQLVNAWNREGQGKWKYWI